MKRFEFICAYSPFFKNVFELHIILVFNKNKISRTVVSTHYGETNKDTKAKPEIGLLSSMHIIRKTAQNGYK